MLLLQKNVHTTATSERFVPESMHAVSTRVYGRGSDFSFPNPSFFKLFGNPSVEVSECGLFPPDADTPTSSATAQSCYVSIWASHEPATGGRQGRRRHPLYPLFLYEGFRMGSFLVLATRGWYCVSYSNYRASRCNQVKYEKLYLGHSMGPLNRNDRFGPSLNTLFVCPNLQCFSCATSYMTCPDHCCLTAQVSCPTDTFIS